MVVPFQGHPKVTLNSIACHSDAGRNLSKVFPIDADLRQHDTFSFGMTVLEFGMTSFLRNDFFLSVWKFLNSFREFEDFLLAPRLNQAVRIRGKEQFREKAVRLRKDLTQDDVFILREF